MKVKVLLFGELRSKLGFGERIIDSTQSLTAEQVLCQTLGDDSEQEIWREKILYAVNQEQVSQAYELKDGDEIALMPPMTGG